MMRDHRLCLCFIVVICACDSSRTVGSGDDSGAAEDSTSKKIADDAARDKNPPDSAPDIAVDAALSGQCVIVYRHTDNDPCCCKEREVVTVEEFDADPCLVESAIDVTIQPRSGCAASGCNLACDCVSPRVPSRIAEMRDGKCRFVGECEDDSGCALGTDTRYCCSCPQVYPRALIEQDPCLVYGSLIGSENPPTACEPDGGCDWRCPLAGACQEPRPFCSATAMLPPTENVCIGGPE